MRFSNQVILFISSCVIIAVCLVLLGGALTFRQLTYNQQQHKLSTVVSLLDEQLDLQPDTPAFAQWLPNWLRAHDIIRLDVANSGGSLYSFRNLDYKGLESVLVDYSYPMPKHPGFNLKIRVEKPFRLLRYDWQAMWGIAMGLIIITLGMWASIVWLRKQLRGAELLQARGNKILAGYSSSVRQGDPREWPNAASKAFDRLLLQIQDYSLERSRFDRLIRHNAFIDELTQLSNRTHFYNQLEAEIRDTDINSGAVLLIYLKGMDDINYEHARSQGDVVLQQVANMMRKHSERYIDASLARLSGDTFAILLSNTNAKDAESVASSLLRQLERIPLPEKAEQDDFYYIGIVAYHYGDHPGRILDRADEAVRVAQMQGNNAWYIEEQSLDLANAGRGSVRWRTMLQGVLEQETLQFYKQAVVDQDAKTVCYELLARITESDGNELTAGSFIPWVDKSGLSLPMDRLSLKVGLEQATKKREQIAINLRASSLIEPEIMRALLRWRMKASSAVRKRLIIELQEDQIAQLNDTQMIRLRALNKNGIQIAVDRAGQKVVSTRYINELQLSYLKLHPSLVRDIQLRQVNRLAVSSLVASCNQRAPVVAVAVEREEEWRVLKRLGVSWGQGFLFGKPKPMD
ncbi:EAL domain-containing protein [Alginatibacterium sediminis]|uniref:EAL domain-containing protein n=1 Tax=Alginatibacterium sediminis TaxID=2164068 RepID=A0A420EL27_9ALTE|nr:EAL domain-containing protein [Alginatibacterium sediminis]RKF21383.1 EAL domain-containing protein [Alginatibacterium sediminis]